MPYSTENARVILLQISSTQRSYLPLGCTLLRVGRPAFLCFCHQKENARGSGEDSPSSLRTLTLQLGEAGIQAIPYLHALLCLLNQEVVSLKDAFQLPLIHR